MAEKSGAGLNKNNSKNIYNNQINYNTRQTNNTRLSAQQRSQSAAQGIPEHTIINMAQVNSLKRRKKPVTEEIRYREGVDRLFLIFVIILLCLGTVMIFSASYANALQYYGDSYFFAKKQLMMAGLGIAAMFIMSIFADYRYLEKLAVPIFLGTLFLNYITPFIGKVTHGATRWIMIFGFQLQPSEFMKLAVVILFAFYITKLGDKMKKIKWGIVVPILIIASIAGALFMQKHLSGLIIIALLCVAMMLIGETPGIFFGIGGAAATLGVFYVINYTDKIIEILNKIGMEHAGKRLAVWLDPFIDPRDAGHQIIQSLYAIGSGGLTGLGWGQSRQKFLYLPEPQNDYIFAILCEELGFIGAILIIALFVLLIWRGFVIAYHAPTKFSSVVVMGITVKVALQFILNIAVVTNILPATGIPMPFFSYGGTALIVLMAEMGIILSISRYSYQEKP
ncbi:MAG: putative lipid II flippase FtsW [Oscillospiraceae bacterium]|nr:putative lipid II flippase FtsW [Oscillospiraceae bacterium]